MSTSIHHGPPGSFKSFTLVQRLVIDALKEGRVVITNIRGLTSIDRILDQFPDYKFPDSADLWFINTDEEKNRQFMARWFHWVPFRALIIIDECQRVYPNRRDFKKEDLDKVDLMGFVPDVFNIEINDEYTGARYFVHRPKDVDTAFDMQRHFQWDIHLSTPNIAKVKDFIREVAESAYRHKSLSGKLPKPMAKLFGLWNSWYEFQHDPENNGKLTSHVNGKPRKYKADERIFNCYQSTATGEHTESQADQSILGDPKLKFILVVMVLALGGFIYAAFRFAELHGESDPFKTDVESGQVVLAPDQSRPVPAVSKGAIASVSVNPDNVPIQQNLSFFDRLGFRLLQVSYQDTTDTDNNRLSFLADSKDGLKPVGFQELFLSGVRVSIHGLCNIKLISPDGSILSLGCSSSVVRGCLATATSQTLAIRRNCSKYGDPKPETKPLVVPQNALVATASNILDK